MSFFRKLLSFIKNRTSFKDDVELVPFISLKGWVKEQQDKIQEQSGIDKYLKDYFQQLNDIYTTLNKNVVEMAEKASLWEKQDKDLAKQIDLIVKRIIEVLHVKERPSINTVFQFNEQLSERIDKSLLLLDKQENVSEEVQCCEELVLFKERFVHEIQQLLNHRQAFEIKLFKSGLRTVQTLSHKVELLYTAILRRDKLQQKLKERMERLEHAQVKKNEKEAVLTKLKEHPFYSHFSHIQDQKNQLQSQLNNYLNEVKFLFFYL